MAYKDYFGPALAGDLAQRLIVVYPGFPADTFVAACALRLPALELKARVAAIAEELARHLPPDYLHALDILSGIFGPENPKETGTFSEFHWLMPVARFVEVYGLAHPQASLDALEQITRRHTGEYAIRPYIEQHYEFTLARLHVWARSPSSHVRRLASEGTRTRLPWARRLHCFVHDPAPVLELLEPLRADPSAYVRKSVANNLHDIAEDHPQLVIDLCTRWEQGAPKATQWIIRHALRRVRLQEMGFKAGAG